jgi:hypothetical protein
VSLQDQLSVAQLERLNLEIETLRKKSRWDLFYSRVPLFATFVPLVALIIGFWQFQRQQAKALTEQQQQRTTQLRNQLRTDLDEMFRFSHDKDQTIGRVSFLLDDMKGLIDSAPRIKDEVEDFRNYERKVTKALVDHIVYEADFEASARDVIFSSRIVTNWTDYPKYLRDPAQIGILQRILQNYVNGMRDFRKNNAPYLQQVSYNEKTGRFNVGEDKILWRHLNFLIAGFEEHLKLLGKGQEESKRKNIEDFEDNLCIKEVAHYFLGADFIDGRCDRK